MSWPAVHPFAGEPHVQLLPSPEVAHALPLLWAHHAELADELGAPLTTQPARATWLLGPAASNPAFAAAGIPAAAAPTVHLDRAARRLVCDAPTPSGVLGTLWRLFDLIELPDGTHGAGPCADWRSAAHRVAHQVGRTHPTLVAPSVPWDRACDRYAPQVTAGSREALTAWLETLGDGHTWARSPTERPVPSVDDSVRWRWSAPGDLQLVVSCFRGGPEAQARWQAALEACAGARRLVVDLRGNPGGNAATADRFRRAFLDHPRVVGVRRARTPAGPLSEPRPIEVVPDEAGVRVGARTWVLVDHRTGSAAEDVVLALRGLRSVTVAGEATAGAIGWTRVLPLVDDLQLSIRFCEVARPDGVVVDGTGLPVDVPLDPTRPLDDIARQLLG